MTAAVTAVRTLARAAAQALWTGPMRMPFGVGPPKPAIGRLAVRQPEADPRVVAREPRVDSALQLLVVVLANLLSEGEETIEDEGAVSPPRHA